MNLRRVELTVYTDNAPALALYRKFGFETEGDARLRGAGWALRGRVQHGALAEGRGAGGESEGRARRGLRTGATSWLAGLPFHDRFVLGFGHTVTVDKQRGCYLGGEGA